MLAAAPEMLVELGERERELITFWSPDQLVQAEEVLEQLGFRRDGIADDVGELFHLLVRSALFAPQELGEGAQGHVPSRAVFVERGNARVVRHREEWHPELKAQVRRVRAFEQHRERRARRERLEERRGKPGRQHDEDSVEWLGGLLRRASAIRREGRRPSPRLQIELVVSADVEDDDGSLD